jgi:hypothetical protein
VVFIGDDHILSASGDHTVCVTQLSSGTIAARTKLGYEAGCAAILPDGRLAVCIARGNAALTDAPAAAADVLKTHGAATFAGATATKIVARRRRAAAAAVGCRRARQPKINSVHFFQKCFCRLP